MMTLRLEKRDPNRTEFYEADTVQAYSRDENGVVSIAAHYGGTVVEHFVGPLPGQAFEAFLMNASGKTVECIRAE